MLLQHVTKLTICSDEDLYTFGLHLGLRVGQIRQKRTNNPNSIEIAALEAVTEWWDSCTKGRSEKVEMVAHCTKQIGKANLASTVIEKLRGPSNGQQTNCNHVQTSSNNDGDANANVNGGSESSEEGSTQQNGNGDETNVKQVALVPSGGGVQHKGFDTLVPNTKGQCKNGYTFKTKTKYTEFNVGSEEQTI